jgi:hypothetical protein
MTTSTYIQQVLPQLVDDFHRLGLTLCQDADSAHTSNATMKWARENDLPIITLPGVSPDFSIIETVAHPVKRKFHTKRVTTEMAGLARFYKLFNEEMDQNMIQNMYNSYTKRLHDCRRADGQMTKY